jgi:hypothetical protein
MCRDRVVSIATDYRLDDRGVGVRVLAESRTFPRRPDRLWGPPNLLSNGRRGFFPGVRGPGREADQSPPASTKIKRMWIYISTPPYAFMVQCLISYAQGQFYLKYISLLNALYIPDICTSTILCKM